MTRLIPALMVSLVLVACSAMMDKGPKVQSVVLAEAPGQAYGRAVSAMALLGGRITTADPLHGVISAEVHNAVLLTVHLVPVPEGTRVNVVGTLLPNKLVVGSFDEVDQYMTLLR
jgi:hypothetical protein